jgi:hypothetical protein
VSLALLVLVAHVSRDPCECQGQPTFVHVKPVTLRFITCSQSWSWRFALDDNLRIAHAAYCYHSLTLTVFHHRFDCNMHRLLLVVQQKNGFSESIIFAPCDQAQCLTWCSKTGRMCRNTSDVNRSRIRLLLACVAFVAHPNGLVTCSAFENHQSLVISFQAPGYVVLLDLAVQLRWKPQGL